MSLEKMMSLNAELAAAIYTHAEYIKGLDLSAQEQGNQFKGELAKAQASLAAIPTDNWLTLAGRVGEINQANRDRASLQGSIQSIKLELKEAKNSYAAAWLSEAESFQAVVNRLLGQAVVTRNEDMGEYNRICNGMGATLNKANQEIEQFQDWKTNVVLAESTGQHPLLAGRYPI